MPRPYSYLNLSLHRHLATTLDPMRWRGSSAEHVCWRRSAVRWAWCRTGPFRRAPATTPSPSEPGPPLHLRPLGRYSSRDRIEVRRRYTSRCDGTACKRSYRYHLWLLSWLKSRRCYAQRGTNHFTHTHSMPHATLLMHKVQENRPRPEKKRFCLVFFKKSSGVRASGAG
jgi:hypothetical protein